MTSVQLRPVLNTFSTPDGELTGHWINAGFLQDYKTVSISCVCVTNQLMYKN